MVEIVAIPVIKRDTFAVPAPISSMLIPSSRTKGKVSIICCLIRSYTMLGLTRMRSEEHNV